MTEAYWKGQRIAHSDRCELVEGNSYFPRDSVDGRYLRPSTTHSTCPWKGEASYYDVVVDGEVNRDAAWFYPDPKPAAENIRGRIAFWRGVEVKK